MMKLNFGENNSTDLTVNSSNVPSGNFITKGGFLGAMWYMIPHLNVAARYDFNYYSDPPSNPALASGYSIQVSAPFENNIFIAAFNRTMSEVDETSEGIVPGIDNAFHIV